MKGLSWLQTQTQLNIHIQVLFSFKANYISSTLPH